MITRSACKQVNESSQEIEEEIMILSDQAVSNEKLKEGKFEAKAIEENSSSSCEEIEVLFDKQNQVQKVHSVSAVETTVIVDKEDKQSEQFHAPIYNIHIHVSPSNGDSSSVPATVQPIIHLHFDESGKNLESVSSHKSIIERRVQSFLALTSTDSINMSTDYSDCSDIVNKMKENNCSSPNPNSVMQRNGTDVDMSNLSNNCDSEISTELQMKKVTENQEPDIKVTDVEEPTSQKQHNNHDKNSDNSDEDKDFESVYPKLQEKLDSLIKKNLQTSNNRSSNKVKEKINDAKGNNSMQNDEDNRPTRQLRSNTSKEPKRLEEPVVIEDTEVIVLSDSDSPTEKSNKEEIIEQKKKERRKRNFKSSKIVEDLDSSEDECGKYSLRKRNVELKKQERVRTRETHHRKCKTPSKEQHMNWVKKVAFAKAFDLQPTVFAEKEILVKSPVKPNKGQNLRSKSQTSSASVKRNEKIQQDESVASCETPKRLSSYQHVNKHLSKEINDVVSSPKALGSQNKREGSKDQVSDSDSEDESDEEICNSKKGRELRNKSKNSLVSVNSNEETQEKDSLVSSGTPKRLSYGCQSLPGGFAVKEILEKSPANSKKAQGVKNRSETSLMSVISNEEVGENESLVSCETPKRFSNASKFQSTEVTEKEILEKSPVNSKTAQELKSIWQTAFASVDRKKEPQQNGGLVSSQTSKRLSSQHSHKRGSSEAVESSPKTLGSLNNKQGSKDEVSTVGHGSNEVICTSAPTPNREENLESVNNKRYVTLLAEGCNFSEILQKFREKHYKDKVKVFFPDKGESNNNHIPQNSSFSANKSDLEDGLKNGSQPGEVSNVSTVKQKKAKEKSDKFKNENKADENSNPFLSLEEPVKCFSSPTVQPLQRTHTTTSPHGKESLNAISSVFHASPISQSNEIHVYNEKNLNCDGGNVTGNKNFEKSSGGNTVNESCNNSSSTGNGTTPEKNILQKGNHDSHEYVNEFRAIKKKLRSLPNDLSNPDLEKKNDIQSKANLENLRKDLFSKCMAQNSSDIKEPEKTDSKIKTKRRGSPESSNLDKSSSSVKKMKDSKEKNVNSNTAKTRSRKGDEDYIPLKASGPTKFAVAPLDKVTPYREHAAKDFKANTLYGKRVTRFNSSKCLEINKSKQRARNKS